MPILNAGNELDCFTKITLSATEIVEAGRYDPEYSRCSIRTATDSTSSTDTGIEIAKFSGVNNLAINYFYYMPSAIFELTNKFIFSAFVGASAVMRIRQSANPGNVWSMQYFDGSTWVNVGNTFGLFGGSLAQLTIFFTGNNFEIYQAGNVLLASGSSPINCNTFTSCRLNNLSVNYRVSNIIVTDSIDPRSLRVKTVPANADGALSQWTGSFTDINEIITNDATFIESTTDAEKSLFDFAPITISSGAIIGVCVGARAAKSALGPQNLRPIIRLGGVDYPLSNYPSVQPTAAGNFQIMELNPVTGNLFTTAEFNNLEYGYESLA